MPNKRINKSNRSRKQKKTKNYEESTYKEFFNKNSELRKELNLYNSLLDSQSQLNESFSRRLLEETKKDFYGLNRKEIFNSQTKLD